MHVPVGIEDLKAVDIQNPYHAVILSPRTLDLQALVNPCDYPREEVVIYCLEDGGKGEGGRREGGRGEGGRGKGEGGKGGRGKGGKGGRGEGITSLRFIKA